MKRLLRALAGMFLISHALIVQAGTMCSDKPPEPEAVIQALELGYKTKLALEESGAEVALISRVGQDLSKYHLRYSHMGVAWRDHPQGRWLLVHELNQCGTASSALFNEGLGNFFMDDVFAYEAEILIPSPAIQQRIVTLLQAGKAKALHDPRYNMLAYPFATRYQNSNQWLLETLAAALSTEPLHTREQAQAWLQSAGYQPTTLHIPTFTRLGARMFKASIAFDDQPFDQRMAGSITTVTTLSIHQFLKQRDPQMKVQVITLPSVALPTNPPW